MANSATAERDRVWMARLCGGDEGALAALIEAYYTPLANVVLPYVNSIDIADDVLQELFLRLWERRDALDIRGSVRGYLYAAARNGALHAAARRAARDRAERAFTIMQNDEVEPFDAAEQLEREDLAAVVRTVVARFPERRREIFILSREHGLSYSEIAETLGVSVSTVKTQMGRAMAVLDATLAPFALVALLLFR